VQPNPQPPSVESATALVQELKDSYQARDYARFVNLFPEDAEAPYRFFLNEPLPGGEASWDRTVELRIHQRMFTPNDTPPGDPPVPQSDTDYRVDGRANFVVIENRTKQLGEAHKFLLYRWEDLGSFVQVGRVDRALASACDEDPAPVQPNLEPSSPSVRSAWSANVPLGRSR
jgi:hypothetical protein